jgi:uncharacterized phage protein (TIGR02220 family)
MKYTITINQQALHKMGLLGEVKANHMAVLEVIARMVFSRMKKMVENDVVYVGVSYETIANEIPFFEIKKDRVKQIVRELGDLGFLVRWERNSAERSIFIGLGPKYQEYTGIIEGETKGAYSGDKILASRRQNFDGNQDTCQDTLSNLESNNVLVDEFVAYLNQITGKKCKVIDPVRKSFKARLKEGYSLEDMKTATLNASMTEFHIEHKFSYITPEFMLRPDKLEKFLNIDKSQLKRNIEKVKIDCPPDSREEKAQTTYLALWKAGDGDWLHLDDKELDWVWRFQGYGKTEGVYPPEQKLVEYRKYTTEAQLNK